MTATSVRSAEGQPSGGPSGVADHSRARMSAPASPPAARKAGAGSDVATGGCGGNVIESHYPLSTRQSCIRSLCLRVRQCCGIGSAYNCMSNELSSNRHFITARICDLLEKHKVQNKHALEIKSHFAICCHMDRLYPFFLRAPLAASSAREQHAICRACAACSRRSSSG